MYRLKRENATSTDGKSTVQADKDRFKINVDGKSTQDTRDGKNKLNITAKTTASSRKTQRPWWSVAKRAWFPTK